MNPAFDAVAFWALVLLVCTFILVGCVVEIISRILPKPPEYPPLHGPDSCMDAVADQEERGGVRR